MLSLPGQPSPPEDAPQTPPEGDADPLAGLQVEEPGETPPEAPLDASPPQAARLTPEQFEAALRATLEMSGAVLKLDSLTASPDQPTFSTAARAIYDSACDIPWLSFLVEPGNIWIQRAVAIGAFALPVAASCRLELAARNTPAATASEDAAGDAVTL